MKARLYLMAAMLSLTICAFARNDQEWLNAGVDYKVYADWLLHFDFRSRFEYRDKRFAQPYMRYRERS